MLASKVQVDGEEDIRIMLNEWKQLGTRLVKSLAPWEIIPDTSGQLYILELAYMSSLVS